MLGFLGGGFLGAGFLGEGVGLPLIVVNLVLPGLDEVDLSVLGDGETFVMVVRMAVGLPAIVVAFTAVWRDVDGGLG